MLQSSNDALAEWLRRVPAKYMGFPRESSNLSGGVHFFFLYTSLNLVVAVPKAVCVAFIGD